MLCHVIRSDSWSKQDRQTYQKETKSPHSIEKKGGGKMVELLTRAICVAERTSGWLLS